MAVALTSNSSMMAAAVQLVLGRAAIAVNTIGNYPVERESAQRESKAITRDLN